MAFWLTPNGGQYYGDKISDSDLETPKRPSPCHDWSNGVWAINIVKAKKLKVLELNTLTQTLANIAIASYPEFETKTWEDQRRECTAWHFDNNISTPYIDALANYRGVDRVVYIQRTLAKVESFSAFASKIVGLRQRYADMIDAAASEEELNSIMFDFS